MLELYPKGQEGVTCLTEKRRKHLRQSTTGTDVEKQASTTTGLERTCRRGPAGGDLPEDLLEGTCWRGLGRVGTSAFILCPPPGPRQDRLRHVLRARGPGRLWRLL